MTSSSNEFLSGDADSSLSIMNSLKISDSDYNKKSGMKIEVIGGEDSYDDSSSDEDDECPPPLQSSMGSTTSPGIATSMEPAQESLMEQMMADALKAKHELERKKNETMRKQAKSSFGFKKGFLNSNKKATKKKTAKSKSTTDSTTRQPTTEQTEPIYELDSEGNILPVANQKQTKMDSLRIAEVQEAMDNQSWQQAFASKSQINSPEFLQQIMNNPKLVKSMSNPKCKAALEALEKNPKEALKRFQGHDEVMEFLNEICKLLGNHFTKLGEMDSSPKEKTKENVPMVQELREPTEEDVGPIAYKAMQKEKERKKLDQNVSFEHDMSKEEKDRVDAIMKNEELTNILMDTEMQRVMQECSQIPGKMQYYMRHDVYGAKLRKLIHAGLLRVA